MNMLKAKVKMKHTFYSFLVLSAMATAGTVTAQDCIDPSLIDTSVVCPMIYDPVCGCNGVTYSNECEAVYFGGVTTWVSGMCTGTALGCTDPFACNYNSNAIEEDGSCEYESCVGCIDEAACNYDPTTLIEDVNSCVFPDLGQDCNGACIDPIACNYWEEPGAGAIVYSEDFEGFSAGDYIAGSNGWTTWSGWGYGSDEDAQVSTEYAFEGVNSLNIYGSGGPMDVLLPVGLNGGEYDASFWMYIPEGSSGYYNVQEDVSPGVGWAFDVSFTVSGEVQIVADEATVGTGIFPHDEWFQMYHNLDMDNNLATLSIDGVTLNSFPFDSPFGGINFFGYGDGATAGNYFVDEIAITLPGNGIIGECTYPGCMDPLASNYDSSAGCSAECIYVGCTDPLACNYNPNAIEDDGSCEYYCPDCEANYDFQGVEWAYFPDPAEGEEFEDASVNAFYEDAFYIMVPTEASQIDPAFALPLDSMVFLGAGAIDVLTGAYFELDALGLSAVCNNSGVSANDCTFTSGTQHCVNFTGTPSVEGDFFISIELLVYVTVFGIPVAQPYEITDIPLLIIAQEFDGCIDPSACNFDPSAIEDDGSCTYPGCMDPLATNYDSSAGCSAECIYVGCTDPLACNYNPSATSDDGSCDYFPCVNCNDAIDIFISEYCEGTGNNKGVEFYNPTNETIDLSNYQLQRYANGSEPANDWVDLIGSIPPQGTHVLINGQIEDLDLGGGAISPACDPAMQALADQLGNPYPDPLYFNGDDALVLVKNGDTVVDIFGKVGEDPGMAWTDDEANGFIDVGDGATWLTINRTLRRKPDVISGVIENPIVFNTLAEYDVFEVNDWSGLGWHNLYCEDGAAGCTNEMACNFSSIATEDDGSCTYPGCQDPSASNYDEEAGCAGECVYLTYDCASIGQSGWEDESIGLYPEWQDAMHGVAWEGEWVFNIPSIIEEPSSGVEYAVHHIDWTTVNGLPDWVDEAEFILGELGEGSQHCIQAAGTPTAPSMYDISAVGEVFISIFGQPFSIGTQTYTAVLEVVGNPNPIPGCTYSMASNYISYATEDDGSCLFTGCMDPQAANYTPLANIDDGSCTEDCAPDADSSCTSDNNGDGVVNVSDLLILLGEFGGGCE